MIIFSAILLSLLEQVTKINYLPIILQQKIQYEIISINVLVSLKIKKTDNVMNASKRKIFRSTKEFLYGICKKKRFALVKSNRRI
jgi:hypothetical protein